MSTKITVAEGLFKAHIRKCKLYCEDSCDCGKDDARDRLDWIHEGSPNWIEDCIASRIALV